MKNNSLKTKITANTKRVYVTLDNTDFNVGDKYNYIFDKKSQQLIVRKSENGNTVSKKRQGSKVKPLIDIRNHAMLSRFSNFEQLKIEVFEDQVIVTGYRRKIIEKVISNILSFSQIKSEYEAKYQESFQLSLSLDSIKQAVGSESSVVDVSPSAISETQEFKIALDVVSLFSGGGLSDFGLKQSFHERFKFNLKQAYDYDKHACSTYARNLGNHIIQADIRKLNLSEVPKSVIKVVTPSCCGLSKQNRSGSEEQKKSQNDLMKYAVEAIKMDETCKVFIMENAPELISKNKGEYVKYVLSELSDFDISFGVLDAANFGAPQHRKRSFLIGSKIGQIDLPTPTHLKGNFKTVAEALDGLDDSSSDSIPNFYDFSDSCDLVKERMSYIPIGGNVKDIPLEIRPKMQFANAYKRLHPDNPSVSIVHSRKTLISPPYANRTLSVREACRLMGLPDTFEVFGSLDAKHQQVCNGVVPSVMKAVGEQILNAFDKVYEKLNISPLISPTIMN